MVVSVFAGCGKTWLANHQNKYGYSMRDSDSSTYEKTAGWEKEYINSFMKEANTLDCLRELPAYAIGTEVTEKTAQFVKDSCLTANELIAYGNKSGTLYCWNVSDVQSMDMSLRELGVKRAPQSWMYLQIPDNKTF